MAGAQLARSRAPETMDEFVARRERDQARREADYVAGQDRWSASTRTGQNHSAARSSDVVALGAQARSAAPAPTMRSPAASASSQMQSGGIRYGSLYAPPPGDLAELRRQQAEFGETRRKIDVQNSWMAVPALAPVAVGLGLGGATALAGRGVTVAAPPLTFLAREAWQRGVEQAPRALTRDAKAALREQARLRYAQANGIPASRMQAEVHHSDPLEYAHLKPGADPNRLANLWGLRKEAHDIASRQWAEFGKELKGRAPTQAELMQAKLRIDRMVEPYIRRAGVPRSNKLPGKGGLR